MSGSELALSYELPGRGRAVFTDRSAGNLSSVGGEGAEHAEASRERLRMALGVGSLARGYQVHGGTVRRLGGAPPGAPPRVGLDDSDGQATGVAGVGAMVLAADCLPVAVGGRGALAVLHAGWRGLAAGVLEEGVRAVRELGGEDPLVAVIGPGAGPCCYEVGPEVHAALHGGRGSGNVDLPAIARARLLAAGVRDVRAVEACTICDERFFSHRREGATAGRQAGVAWLS